MLSLRADLRLTLNSLRRLLDSEDVSPEARSVGKFLLEEGVGVDCSVEAFLKGGLKAYAYWPLVGQLIARLADALDKQISEDLRSERADADGVLAELRDRIAFSEQERRNFLCHYIKAAQAAAPRHLVFALTVDDAATGSKKRKVGFILYPSNECVALVPQVR